MSLFANIAVFNRRAVLAAAGALAVLVGSNLAAGRNSGPAAAGHFTIAVIPDTQNYIDFRHQVREGFPFDASKLYLQQMQYVADHLQDHGGDVAFVAGLGDIWQNGIRPSDIQARAATSGIADGPNRGQQFGLLPKVAEIEVPMARKGYELLAARTPFSAIPGNHDYDWSWKDGDQIRVGGLVSYTSAFSDQSPFFKGKQWYVGSHAGGADSAQIFTAGGYRFLVIGLQFDASDDSLAWARTVIGQHPGLPTIVTTHRFIDTNAERASDIRPEVSAGPLGYNSPQSVWEKLIQPTDQIFLVLNGHYNGQAHRVDDNKSGHKVYQILSDYQNRHQTAKDAGGRLGPGEGIGDGWMRFMSFDMTSAVPVIRVRTYSTYYHAYSSQLPTYVAWYKADEKPNLSDQEFLASEEFTVELSDFRKRFGSGCQKTARGEATREACGS
jgi:hypothetical protein